MKKFWSDTLRNKFLLIIILPAMVLTLVPIVLDGQNGCIGDRCGFIIGTNFRDGIWFQAVASTAFKTFPFQLPNYAGEALQGYHYLPNLAAYLLSQIGVPVTFTFYKLIPILFFSMLTIISIKFARRIHDNVVFISIFLFTIYFGMHLSLITSLYHFGEIRNSVLINTFQATRLLESPHAALAMILLYIVVYFIWNNNLTVKKRVLISFFIFLSFGTKFYVAFSMLSIIGMYELISWLQKKQNFMSLFMHTCLYIFATCIAVLVFYNPFSAGSASSTFIFSPFATAHHLIESQNLFYNADLVNARYFLYEAGWSPRLLAIELFSVVLFIIFYLGTRVLGFFYLFKMLILKKLNAAELAITFSILISIAISVLFIQKGDWFNPIQFAVPAAYLMSISTAQLLYGLIKKNPKIGYSILTVFILLTLPANLVNASYWRNSDRLVISTHEMAALSYLEKQPYGIVFAPIDEFDMAYVSAFTGKPTYLNFVNTLENAGVNFEKRLTHSQQFDPEMMPAVEYVYIPLNAPNHAKMIIYCEQTLETIYENEEVRICKKLTK